MRLRAGDKLYVPYTQRHLKQLIDLSMRMIVSATIELAKLLKKQHLEQDEFESFLLKIEAISILANVGAGLARGAALTSTALKATSVAKTTEVAGEALNWIAFEGGKTSAEILGMAIEASKAPKKGIIFYLRHSPIGWLSPTYWASLWAAVSEHEWEAFLYGAEGVAHKRAEELTRQTLRYVNDLNSKIGWMRYQMASPIYDYRV